MATQSDPARVPVLSGFDFTAHMRSLCVELCVRLDELAHVDVARIAIRFCQARKSVTHGLQASLTPLRFQGGALECRRRGRTYTVERIYDRHGREMLYLLSFYLPRFQNRTFEEKLTTVVHELWHVGPGFDGDLRRHPGRCWAHSHSQAQYDAEMRVLAEKWLSLDPPAESYAFLRYSFTELVRHNGHVCGQKIRTPKLIRQLS